MKKRFFNGEKNAIFAWKKRIRMANLLPIFPPIQLLKNRPTTQPQPTRSVGGTFSILCTEHLLFCAQSFPPKPAIFEGESLFGCMLLFCSVSSLIRYESMQYEKEEKQIWHKKGRIFQRKQNVYFFFQTNCACDTVMLKSCNQNVPFTV